MDTTASSATTALRALRPLVREWLGFLGAAAVIAAGLVLLRVLGLVYIVGEEPGFWWGVSGVFAMSVVIAATFFAIIVPATYLRPAFAAGLTRSGMALAWVGAAVWVLLTGAVAVLLTEGLVRVLAAAGIGVSTPDAPIVVDFVTGMLDAVGADPAIISSGSGLLGTQAPNEVLAWSLALVGIGTVAAMVIAPAIVLLFLRFPWWVGALVLVLGVPLLTSVLGVAGSGPVALVVVLALAAAGGWAMLRSLPVKPAMAQP